MAMAIATAPQAMAAKASARTAGSDSGRINRCAVRTGAGTDAHGRDPVAPADLLAGRARSRLECHGALDDGVSGLEQAAVISGSMSKRSAVRPRLRATDVRITL